MEEEKKFGGKSPGRQVSTALVTIALTLKSLPSLHSNRSKKSSERINISELSARSVLNSSRKSFLRSSLLPVNENVEFSKLSWEDKERVLKILFAKINNVHKDDFGLQRKQPKRMRLNTPNVDLKPVIDPNVPIEKEQTFITLQCDLNSV